MGAGTAAEPRPGSVVARVAAHRGSSSVAPENTMSALRRAIDDGADCAEIDVQETADGVVVLLHDADLARVAGVRRGIWELTWKQSRGLDVGSWFSSRFAGERIPSLEQVLTLTGGRIGLNIELKYNGHDQRLGERVAELVDAAGLAESTIITSLDAGGLRRVRACRPALRLGLVVTSPVGDTGGLDVEALSMDVRIVSPRAVRANREAGLETHAWTANDRDCIGHMLDCGVDCVITDYPRLAREVLAGRAPRRA